MDNTRKILKYLGIDNGAVDVTWSPDSVSRDQCSSQITHLEDDYVLPNRFSHSITSQGVNTCERVPCIREPEIRQHPIDVEVIIVTPVLILEQSYCTDLSKVNMPDREAHCSSPESIQSCKLPDTLQESKSVSTPKRRSKFRKLKNTLSRILSCYSSAKTSRVSSSIMIDEVTTVHELNLKKEEDSLVSDAVKRLRQRAALFYA